MKKLIILLLSTHSRMSRKALLRNINKAGYKIKDRGLRRAINRYIESGLPLASTLSGYSIIKSWKAWEMADDFLSSYIGKLQRRRTRLKKNVSNYLINPKLFYQ